MKRKIEGERAPKKPATEETINPICTDCRNDCKQDAAVSILNCSKKVRIDEQLTLFDKQGKPRKWRKKLGRD